MRSDLTIDEFIAHYGVKGMRWGVRKKRKPSGDYKRTAPLRKRHASELTDKQLQDVNRRLNLEKQYKSLNPSLLKKGEMGAKVILGSAGTIAGLYKLSQTGVGKAIINKGKDFVELGKFLVSYR